MVPETDSKLENLLRKFLEAIVAILFIVMVCLVFAQVAIRFLTTDSLTWSEELSRFVMIWLIYSASVLTYLSNAHIAVDALTSALKGLPKLLAEVVSRILVVVFVVIILLGALRFLPTTTMQRSPANEISMALVYVAIPISMLLVGVIAVVQIFKTITEYRKTGRSVQKG